MCASRSYIQCLKIVSCKQTLRRRSCQRIDISKRARRGSRRRTRRCDIHKPTITPSSWIRLCCRLVTSLLSLHRRDRARSSAVAPIVDSHRIRLKSGTFAQLKPLEVSAGPDENGRPVDNTHRVSLTDRASPEAWILRRS